MGEDVAQVISNYEKIYRSYYTTLQPVYSRMRSAIGLFYATDNVREFGSIRLIDR